LTASSAEKVILSAASAPSMTCFSSYMMRRLEAMMRMCTRRNTRSVQNSGRELRSATAR
jgi:hypothetical protein